jgi:hypothetical protein
MTSIPRIVAAHVLAHFNEPGGMKAGSFTTRLIDAIAAADHPNQTKLAQVYPDYVAAVQCFHNDFDGVEHLYAIATNNAEHPRIT